MEHCPDCGCADYKIETVNQTEIKRCRNCGRYFEDVGHEFAWQSFAPPCERDANGHYPFCPKCGCKDIKYLSMDDVIARGGIISAWIAGVPYERDAFMNKRYECQNPNCWHRWQ